MCPFSPFSFFFIYFALLLQSHSASVVFPIPQDYWTKIKHTNPSPIPLQFREPGNGGERKKTVGVEKEKGNDIFVDESHCFSGGNNLLSTMGNRKYARLPLGLNLYWRGGTTTVQHFLEGFFFNTVK